MQAFLYFDFLALGIIMALAWRYGLAHFRPEKHDLEKHQANHEASLSPALKKELTAEAEAKMRHTLDLALAKFQKQLSDNQGTLIEELKKLSHEVVKKEIDRYKVAIGKIEEETEAITASAKAEITTGQGDLKAQFKEELEAEKRHLTEQIDTKLADAVTAFLLDTLGHNVDLGAQSAYLTNVLEEHKEEFKQGINDEVPAA